MSEITRRTNEIPDNQEVSGVSRLRDDIQLVIQPFLHFGAQWHSVPDTGAFRCQFAPAVRFPCSTSGGNGNDGTKYFLENCTSTRVGNLASVFSSTSGRSPENRVCHFRRTLEVQTVIVFHAIAIVAILAQSDAQQHIMRVVIFVTQKVRVVGRDNRQAQRVGQREDLCC